MKPKVYFTLAVVWMEEGINLVAFIGFHPLYGLIKLCLDIVFALVQPTHDLTRRDQLYSLIKEQEYGIVVEELKDSYPSVLEDLQVTALVFVLMILSLICYILNYLNQFDTFMAELNSTCGGNILGNQLAIVFDECLFFYELFKSLEGTRFLVLVLPHFR